MEKLTEKQISSMILKKYGIKNEKPIKSVQVVKDRREVLKAMINLLKDK